MLSRQQWKEFCAKWLGHELNDCHDMVGPAHHNTPDSHWRIVLPTLDNGGRDEALGGLSSLDKPDGLNCGCIDHYFRHPVRDHPAKTRGFQRLRGCCKRDRTAGSYRVSNACYYLLFSWRLVRGSAEISPARNNRRA